MYEINLRIQQEDDLYSPYDERRLTLRGDVADYLAGQYNTKELGDEIILKIKSDGPLSYERVRAAFRELIRDWEIRTANQRRLNGIKQLWLIGVGSVFVAAAILLDGILNPILVELISIVGSFAVWEAANIWIVQGPKIRRDRKTMKGLVSTKIVLDCPEE